MIKKEPFKGELEQLGILLIQFCEWMKSQERVLTNFEHFTIIEAESLIDFIDLILSDETGYGYLSKVTKKEV